MPPSDAPDRVAATPPLYLFVTEGGSYVPDTDEPGAVAMYRLACRECGDAFAEGEKPVPSRSIRGNPLVHEECS